MRKVLTFDDLKVKKVGTYDIEVDLTLSTSLNRTTQAITMPNMQQYDYAIYRLIHSVFFWKTAKNKVFESMIKSIDIQLQATNKENTNFASATDTQSIIAQTHFNAINQGYLSNGTDYLGCSVFNALVNIPGADNGWITDEPSTSQSMYLDAYVNDEMINQALTASMWGRLEVYTISEADYNKIGAVNGCNC